jgi:hypothetical protein
MHTMPFDAKGGGGERERESRRNNNYANWRLLTTWLLIPLFSPE